MRLLDRYLLRELLVPLGYCLCGFLVFWITSDLVVKLEDFRERAMGLGGIAEYYVMILPEFLVLVLPLSLLLAMLYALTNHARHQEITAIRAAGVSLWRLALPYLGVGFVASLGLFAANEFWVPRSLERAEAIMDKAERAEPNAPGRNEYRNLYFESARDGRRWRIGVYDLKTGEMSGVGVYPTERGGSQPWELRAERAQWVDGVWTFYNVLVMKEPEDPSEPPVPVLRTNVLAVSEFLETPEEISSEVKIRESMSLRLGKRMHVPLKDIVNYLRLHPHPSRSDWYWLHTTLHGRLAAPLTCMVVVLVALPFGAAGGRRNVFVGVASSIVICFAYFVLQQVGVALGSTGRVQPWLAAWFPNLAFGLMGLWMTFRIR